MAYTSLRSDYESFLRERNKNLAGVSEWERLFLQPLTQQYESKVEQAQEVAQYDISQAYANYKRNQMRLMQQNIDTGAQQQIGSSLKSAYTSAYGQAQQTLASNISSLTQDYQEALTANQQQIQDTASYIKKIQDLTLEKAGLNEMSMADLLSQGYYKKTDVPGEYEITDKLRNVYQQQWYNAAAVGEDTIEAYIRQQSGLEGEELENLVDFMYENQALLNESIGLDINQRTLNKQIEYAPYLQALSSTEAPKIGTSEGFNAQSFALFELGYLNPAETYERDDAEKLVKEVENYVDSLGLTSNDLGFDVEDEVIKIIRDSSDSSRFRSKKWKAFKTKYNELITSIKNTAETKYAQYR